MGRLSPQPITETSGSGRIYRPEKLNGWYVAEHLPSHCRSHYTRGYCYPTGPLWCDSMPCMTWTGNSWGWKNCFTLLNSTWYFATTFYKFVNHAFFISTNTCTSSMEQILIFLQALENAFSQQAMLIRKDWYKGPWRMKKTVNCTPWTFCFSISGNSSACTWDDIYSNYLIEREKMTHQIADWFTYSHSDSVKGQPYTIHRHVWLHPTVNEVNIKSPMDFKVSGRRLLL